MEQFKGYIDHIIFRNDDNGYTVMTGIMEGKEYTLVGTLPTLNPGETIQASGTESNHPVYGPQFTISSIQIIAPTTEDAVRRYLASGSIKGIGAALAARIIKIFGSDSLRIIENEPERLSEVKGISPRMAADISSSFNAKHDMRDAVIFLQGFGISVNLAEKIYRYYKDKFYHIIKENPYQLAEEIEGIGFKRCDIIAQKSGIKSDSDFRIAAGIQFILAKAEGQGHSFLPLQELLGDAEDILNISIRNIKDILLDLQLRGKVVVKGENVYRSSLYYAELEVASRLHQLNIPGSEKQKAEAAALLEQISSSEDFMLDRLQADAIIHAASSGLLVITGGPGTGKTTTINIMLRLFKSQDKTIFMAAPTGRASKRMSEATGEEAKTIHRLLEYQHHPAPNESQEHDASLDQNRRGWFERNENMPLECDVVIIDEMSMVDIFLMNSLLKAITKGTRLILVGDANQLPSVGAGNVLRDLIDSGVIPTIRLSHIFRQAASSDIVVNAHKINEGIPVDLGKPSKDFLFIKADTPERILSSIEVLLTDKLPPYLNEKSLSIQVMAAQRKGILGVENLNRVLQSILNPADKDKPEKELNGTLFRLGDKVMQTKNDYNRVWETRGKFGMPLEKGEGIFNGDIGIISEINHFAATLTIVFEDRFVEYPFRDCDSLDLAYAITIHKSQGSEYPAVIIPMYRGPHLLMNKNLLYTAITRAKKCVCLVGNPHVFETMAQNETETKRYSSLALRLRELDNVHGNAE